MHGLIDLKTESHESLMALFSWVNEFKKILETGGHFPVSAKTDPALLLFFEPSTRTRFSFEMACLRLGVKTLLLNGSVGSSLEKGETIEDTLLNLAQLRPSLAVIRCGSNFNMREASKEMAFPILNAGWGAEGHPSQALLDVFSIFEVLGDTKGLKLCLVGDIRHSRVASSHLELAPHMGIELGFCGPKEFLPAGLKGRYFESFEEALRWSDVVMMLRIQFERHLNPDVNTENYHGLYGLNEQRLIQHPNVKLFLHPGPVNHGLEIDGPILKHAKSLVHKQVQNGAFVRQVLVARALDLIR